MRRPRSTAGGGYPSEATARAHSSNTEATKPAAAGAAAISPATAPVRVEIVALTANPQNFAHISAIMLVLIRLGTPPAASASRVASQRAEGLPVSSPNAVSLVPE